MTLGGFLEYLLDNDCETARDYDCTVIQIKRRGPMGNQFKITIPYTDKSKKVKDITVCRVCHALDVPIPADSQHAEEVLKMIMDHHKNMEQSKPKK